MNTNTLEVDCRDLYYAYMDRRYNEAELLFYLVHSLKSHDFYSRKLKTLMIMIQEMLITANWRDDHIYDAWSRHSRFSFLGEYDESPFWAMKKEVSVDESPITTSYQPADVISTIIKHWDSIYDHPYLYTMVTHLIESTVDLTPPTRFEERIKKIIYKASKLYYAPIEKEQEDLKKMEEANMIMTYAYSLMGLGASKGRVQSPDEGC